MRSSYSDALSEKKCFSEIIAQSLSPHTMMKRPVRERERRWLQVDVLGVGPVLMKEGYPPTAGRAFDPNGTRKASPLCYLRTNALPIQR
jgi:hypothetical protein